MPYTKTEWEAADDGATMLWSALHHDTGRPRDVTAAALACARLAVVHLPASDARSRRALDVVGAWLIGRATDGEVEVARVAAAHAALGTHGHSPASLAAAAVVHAVTAVTLPWSAQSAASYAADATHAAAPRHVREAARREADRRMAAIVRAHVPWRSVWRLS